MRLKAFKQAAWESDMKLQVDSDAANVAFWPECHRHDKNCCEELHNADSATLGSTTTREEMRDLLFSNRVRLL